MGRTHQTIPVLIELEDPKQLSPSPLTIRKYDCSVQQQEAIEASIRAIGQIQPLICRVIGYSEPKSKRGEIIEVICGQRRHKAALNLDLKRIKAIVYGFGELDDADVLNISLADNLHHQSLSPLEEVEAIVRIIALRLQKSVQDAATIISSILNNNKLSFSNNVVSQLDDPTQQAQYLAVRQVFLSHHLNPKSFNNHKLPLLSLPPDLKLPLAQGKISASHALQLRRIGSPDTRQAMLFKVLDQSWSSRQLNEQINQLDPANLNSRSNPRTYPSPRTSSPRTSSPRTSSPRTSSPRTSSPRTSSPRTSSPRTSSSRTRKATASNVLPATTATPTKLLSNVVEDKGNKGENVNATPYHKEENGQQAGKREVLADFPSASTVKIQDIESLLLKLKSVEVENHPLLQLQLQEIYKQLSTLVEQLS
ncbi:MULTISPECIES: ParB/RepB/Spo0J family partition protein [unclassified Coleofasciculus]|uniref:ParB/RepB/Spo0J family partition protein n=1 Tax=unclassified Coleofasciculus TaxID=2692782 RepID=UPI0018817AF9|nr:MULTISPECIES: ParB N-terminal domain-containing protein [unclassified Coleofasciculus]MBE9124735.1 ParB N-terminal domain-containing protein [Coleofasciculus sp. LEGE 07081]MBE9148187.1 ParB N-terminal domain-containing protein [Coleofasciculus sp. LEGE 07092]